MPSGGVSLYPFGLTPPLSKSEGFLEESGLPFIEDVLCKVESIDVLMLGVPFCPFRSKLDGLNLESLAAGILFIEVVLCKVEILKEPGKGFCCIPFRPKLESGSLFIRDILKEILS